MCLAVTLTCSSGVLAQSADEEELPDQYRHVNADTEGLHDELRAALSSVAVEALADEANRLLPSFVRTRGEVVLELRRDAAGAGPGVDVALREHGGAAFGIDVLGRGVARWVAIALRAARDGAKIAIA